MLQLIKKIPIWGWIIVVVVILFVWQSISGWAESRKLYTMVLDNLREDQSQIVEDKDKWIKACEDEIAKLAEDKAKIQKEKLALQKKNAQSELEISRLMGENHDLQNRLSRIVVSTDPDKLLDDLRSRGINIRRIPSH
jgi:chromosome segregation ATPase